MKYPMWTFFDALVGRSRRIVGPIIPVRRTMIPRREKGHSKQNTTRILWEETTI